jgi:hypothetical protein
MCEWKRSALIVSGGEAPLENWQVESCVGLIVVGQLRKKLIKAVEDVGPVVDVALRTTMVSGKSSFSCKKQL